MASLVAHFINISVTTVFSFCYYRNYIASFGISKDVQNRLDALQDFQTLNVYLADNQSLQSINHLMDLFTSLLQMTVNKGGSIYFTAYLTIIILIILDLNFKEFFKKDLNFYLVKFITLSFLLIPPFGFGLWEHHTVFVVIAIITCISRVMNLNYYFAFILAIILDPLAIIFVYLKDSLKKRSNRNWIAQICLVFFVIFTIFTSNNFAMPSNKFQLTSLFIMLFVVCFIIMNNFIVRFIQIDIFVLTVLIFVGVSIGWNPTNRVFMDYLIFLPVFIIASFQVHNKNRSVAISQNKTANKPLQSSAL